MFTYRESIPTYYLRNTSQALQIQSTNFIEYKLIRLLLGIIDIELDDGTIINQRNNYASIPSAINTRQSLRTLRDSIAPNSLQDFENYLIKSNTNNRGLIQEILTEFSFYIDCIQNKKQTQAFLHLYRTFEFISYSFPLIHASISRNYKGTFANLKSYFKDNVNEISFLNKFVEKFLENDPVLETSVDVNIRNVDQATQNQLYATIKRIFSSQTYLNFDDQNQSLNYEYKDTFNLFYFIRNRYFHFALGGQTNISSHSIRNPEFLFEHFNPGFSNWITYLYIEILRVQIDRWK